MKLKIFFTLVFVLGLFQIDLFQSSVPYEYNFENSEKILIFNKTEKTFI